MPVFIKTHLIQKKALLNYQKEGENREVAYAHLILIVFKKFDKISSKMSNSSLSDTYKNKTTLKGRNKFNPLAVVKMKSEERFKGIFQC